MKEAGYQKSISNKYEKEGYTVIKLIRTNITGISDLLILKAGEIPIFLECKTPIGKLSEVQKYRLDQFSKKGFVCKVSWGHEIKDYKM
jgi:hypothetical protein